MLYYVYNKYMYVSGDSSVKDRYKCVSCVHNMCICILCECVGLF